MKDRIKLYPFYPVPKSVGKLLLYMSQYHFCNDFHLVCHSISMPLYEITFHSSCRCQCSPVYPPLTALVVSTTRQTIKTSIPSIACSHSVHLKRERENNTEKVNAKELASITKNRNYLEF